MGAPGADKARFRGVVVRGSDVADFVACDSTFTCISFSERRGDLRRLAVVHVRFQPIRIAIWANLYEGTDLGQHLVPCSSCGRIAV